MKTIEQLNNAFQNKKQWEPRPGGDGTYKPNPIVARILTLRNLEQSVSFGIEYAQRWQFIPSELQEAYNTFIQDEEKHDTQLFLLSKHCGGIPINDKFSRRYNELLATHDSLLLNFILEQVFIVTLPLLQKHGDTFCNYVASWILLDEAIHILFGRYYLALKQIRIDDEVMEFAISALDYVAGDDLELKKHLRKVFLKNLAGKVSQDVVESQAVIPPRISFFEQKQVVY
jgi:hypothetical protein